MTVMVTANLLTRADLDALHDDGLRHELIAAMPVEQLNDTVTNRALAVQELCWLSADSTARRPSLISCWPPLRSSPDSQSCTTTRSSTSSQR